MDDICLSKIRSIYRSILQFQEQLVKATSLNMNEAMLLYLLSDGQSRLAGEVAEEMGLTRSNTSKIISSLETKHFIRREPCKHDNRCMRFRISQSGLEILRQIRCDKFIHLPTELNLLIKKSQATS